MADSTFSDPGKEWPCPPPRQELGPLPHEDSNLMLHLQRLETTLSVCAEEPDHSQLFTHLGRMALEFNRLASKVHKNEQRTSILQVRLAGRGSLGVGRCASPPSSSGSSWESQVLGGLLRVTLPLGADFGLLVWGGEQGKEVVGRGEEEEGSWEIWDGQCRFHGWGPWMWAGWEQPCLVLHRQTGGEREGTKARGPSLSLLHRLPSW